MPEYGNPAERRVHTRYGLHMAGEVEVLYRRDLDRMQDEKDKEYLHSLRVRHPVNMLDISRGGTMITFDAEFSPNDVLQVHFCHPITARPVILEGQLMWMKRNAAGIYGKYCGGLSFRNSSEDEVKTIVEYAASRQTASS